MKVPFYAHALGDSEKRALQDSLDNPILTSGPLCRQVESLMSEYFLVQGSKLVNSWTNGAVATLLAMGVGPGDEVIVPALTFVACANVVKMVGAKVVFCDVDPNTLMMTPELIRKVFTENTKVIMVVNLYGQLADVKSISKSFKSEKVWILEDCAHSFESESHGTKPGTYSDAAIFSFYATKNITCGEGGAIITNNLDLLGKIQQTCHHGMSAAAQDRFKDGIYQHWDVNILGTKANLPDILASLLVSQLEVSVIDAKLANRAAIAARYKAGLSHLPIRFQVSVSEKEKHAWHLFAIGVDELMRDKLIIHLNNKGIGVTVNFRAIPELKYYQNEASLQAYPISVSWGRSTLSLPLYPTMPPDQVDYVIESVQSFYGETQK